jgi:cytochrome c556
MFRIALVVATLAIGIAAVVAHPRDIVERQAMMKLSGAQAKIGNQMARGEIPFELAKAHVIFAVFADKAAKLPSLFPHDSRTGGTRARAAIWEKPDEWRAAIDQFAADIEEARAQTADLESFKAGFRNVGRNCVSCHDVFRGPPLHHHHHR